MGKVSTRTTARPGLRPRRRRRRRHPRLRHRKTQTGMEVKARLEGTRTVGKPLRRRLHPMRAEMEDRRRTTRRLAATEVTSPRLHPVETGARRRTTQMMVAMAGCWVLWGTFSAVSRPRPRRAALLLRRLQHLQLKSRRRRRRRRQLLGKQPRQALLPRPPRRLTPLHRPQRLLPLLPARRHRLPSQRPQAPSPHRSP